MDLVFQDYCKPSNPKEIGSFNINGEWWIIKDIQSFIDFYQDKLFSEHTDKEYNDLEKKLENTTSDLESDLEDK